MIGREKEVSELVELYERGEAELIAVYGRRRVGKTYLVDETFKGRITFRHAGLSPIEISDDSKPMKAQLQNFYYSLITQGMKKSHYPKDWLEAFFMLVMHLQSIDDGERQIVFLDELPWMDTPRSGFITAFESFWNNWACHRNVMVIVSGSATSWMRDRLINNHGGLYGRVTHEINLKPFSLRECEMLFDERKISLSSYDIVQSYMIFGGIPYYLQYFEKEYSLPQNIDRIFFAKNAILGDEYNRLFASLFVNAETIKSIVGALFTKRRGLSRKELTELTGITDRGELSKQLKALKSGDFIMEYDSFGNDKRETFYKLTDSFCIFYLEFVRGEKRRKKQNWVNIEDAPDVRTWKGYAFENVCWNHRKQIKNALQIGGVSTTESLWSKRGTKESQGTQIDMIIARKDNVVNMCEMKFYSDDFVVELDYHKTLERRKKIIT